MGAEGSKGGLDPDSEVDVDDTHRTSTKSLRPAGGKSGPRSKVAGIKELPALARRSLQLRRWKRRQLPGQLCGVIRHAERADGIYAFINGQRWTQTEDFRQYPMDPPLSDAGIEGAKEVGQQVADFADAEGVPVHTVISSPYFRCVQTAVEVCIKLGPHIRLIIDWSLGEVYGPSVMGAFEPLCATRPFEGTLRYIAFKGVTCVQKAVGKWPTWPEDLKCARKRYANGYLSYLHRSALAKRNFVIVTHADCVGAALSLMPSQAGFAVESVEYGGMLLATRGLEEAKANFATPSLAEVPDREDLNFTDVMPSQAPSRRVSDTAATRGDKSSWFSSKARRRHSDGGKKRMNAWDEAPEDADGSGSDRAPSPERLSTPYAKKVIEMPKAADGWKVRIHNVNTRNIPKEKASKSTKAMKSIKSLVRNTTYTQEQIETLLGMSMSDKPLEAGEELQTNQRNVKAVDSRILSKTDCSLATYVFGMSECGSNMDDCRSQCSESEFLYTAMHGVTPSREGTLDQIDEINMEPGSPLPTERYQSHEMKRIIESGSRRTGVRDHKRHLSPPLSRTVENMDIDDPSPQDAPRSVTLEELRNLNEGQKRELIYASTSERREKLTNGIPRTLGMEKKMGLKGKNRLHSGDLQTPLLQSPTGSSDLGSWNTTFGSKDSSRRDMRHIHRRSLNTIPSDTEMMARSESPSFSDDGSFSSLPGNDGGRQLQLAFPEKAHSQGRLSNFMQQAGLKDAAAKGDVEVDDARYTAATTAAISDTASGDSSVSAASSQAASESLPIPPKAGMSRPSLIQTGRSASPDFRATAAVAQSAGADNAQVPAFGSGGPDTPPSGPARIRGARPSAIQVTKPEAPNLSLVCVPSASPEADHDAPRSPPPKRLSEAKAKPVERGGSFNSPKDQAESQEHTEAKGASFDNLKARRERLSPLRIEVARDTEKPAIEIKGVPKAEVVEISAPPAAEVDGRPSSSPSQGTPAAFSPTFEGSALMKRRSRKAATTAGPEQQGPAAGLRLEPLPTKEAALPCAVGVEAIDVK